MKVYCNTCKYCRVKVYQTMWGALLGEPKKHKLVCFKNEIQHSDFYGKEIDYKECQFVNKNNDCKDYEIKLNFIQKLFNKLSKKEDRKMKIEENKLEMKENFSKKIKDMLLTENCDMSCGECPMNIFENENISCLDIARSLYETYIKEDKKDDIQ